MRNRILVIAAHPDDEFLGCGGTLINHRNNGDDVGILIMSEGSTSRDKKRNTLKRKKELLELKKTASKIANQIKAKFVKFNSFPDNRMDSVNFLDVVLPFLTTRVGKTKFGTPASKSEPYVPSLIYNFCFFFRIILTIVDPDSATIALPGSQKISGNFCNFKFFKASLISLI